MTPITFVGVGRTEMAYRVVERVVEKGFYVNAAIFPAVSVNRLGFASPSPATTRRRTFKE